MIKNDELLAVTGDEALYPMFFKEYVVRRKTDLVNPKVFSLGDVELPRNSMFIYTPKHADDLGPSNQEPFISNYPDDVFIGFESQLRIIAGKARPLPLEERKVIQKYRAGHYRYKYLKNINSAMKREKDLIVINTSLGQLKWNYIINRFTQFDRSYNQLNNLMDTINLKTQNNERQVFFKIELPDLIPVYTKFLEISRHYKKAFTKDENDNLIFNGINDQAIKPLRNTGAYWLIDWFNFLIGEYEYSLFNRINPEVLDRVNFILTKNGKCVIIKPGLLKEWLDELNEVKDDVVNTYTSQRVNAVKRTMTILMKLASTEYLDLDTENEKEDQSNTSKDTKGGQGKEPESQNEESIETDTDESTDHDNDLFTTLLMGNDRSNETSNEDEGTDTGGARSSSDTEVEPESWTSEIDDSQFDTIEETGPVDTRLGKTGFDTPSKGVEVALERLARTGKLSLSQRDFYLAQAEKYRDLAMPDGTSLEDFIILDTELLNNLPRKLKAPKGLKGITDEKYLESSVQIFKTGYVTEFLEKDIVRSILAVQNGGVCLTGFEKSSVENADGEYDVYNISLLPVGGKQTTFPIKVPKIRPDGTFVVDGQKRTKGLQRRDIPVRMLDHYRVGLTSYYGRKLIVSRSKAVKDDYGLWLSKQIRVKGQAGEIELQVGGQPQYKIPVPKTYSDLAKRFRSLKCKDIEFIFSTKQLLEKDPTLRSLMTAESTVVGFKNNHPVILDDHGNLSFKGKVFDTFENFLGIDTRKAPVEFAEININGFKFPMGVVLSYFFGFDNLLKMLNVPYRTVPGGQRIKLEKDEFPLQFADETLIFNRRDPMSRLIFGGMSRLKNLGIFNRIDMNDPGVWVTVINNPKVKHTHFKEMSNMFDYFIDPITREELVKWGYSTSFDYLLLEATELLKTDKHEHEVEIQEQRFVGYESIAGSVYRQITKAVCKSRAQPNPDTAKISVHPEAVMLEAGLLDTAIDLVEEVSPVHEVKEQEVVTFGGNDGRDPDSMVRRTRGQLPSYIGIISEAGKDSGKVGYVTYTTSNPKVADYRGNVDINADVGNVGLGSVTMNLLGGLNQDDPKRALFAGAQQSQVMGAMNYTPDYIRTPYHTLLAHRTSELYSKPAKLDGEVIEVTDLGIKFRYEDGTEDFYPLGLKIGVGAGEYHRHTRVTDLRVGDKFKTGDILGWDEMFFERDFANPRQVVWKSGFRTTIALIENQFTFEDSFEMSQELASETKSPYILKEEINFNFTNGFKLHVKVGDEVTKDTILCDIEDGSLSGLESDLDTVDHQLERLGVKQKRSPKNGTVVDIKVIYNGDLQDMSPDVLKVVKYYDRKRKEKAISEGSKVYTGNVAGIKRMKESLEEGRVKIEVYVEEIIESQVADKFVIGNQMKGTIGNIFEQPFMTQDGRPVHLIFSFKSMYNRMVLSLRNKIVTCAYLEYGTQLAINAYRGIK